LEKLVHEVFVPITLKVKNSSQLLPEKDSLRILKKGTMTIGRGTQNDLVLPDPEHRVSSLHCIISEVNDKFYLKDTSTNGVFLNLDNSPIGRGNTVLLGNGDRIKFLQFEIEVSLTSETLDPTQVAPEKNQLLNAWEIEDHSPLSAPISTLDDILKQPDEESPRQVTNNLPQENFDLQNDFKEEEAPEVSQDVNNAPGVDDFFNAPQAVPEIPPDWDHEWKSENFKADNVDQSYPPLEKKGIDTRNHQPSFEHPPKTKNQNSSSHLIESPSALDQFLTGAGLDGPKIPEDKIPETMKMLGEVFREVVEGLKGLLDARSNIKNEFRLKQTMIGRTNNNPLQFSLNVEEAMATLLTNDRKGYLSPTQAFQKSFNDIKAHELAILTGMQAALASSLARFDPKKIEEQIKREEQGLGNLLTPKKTLYWEEFARIYQRIVNEAEDDFYNMFGREFSRAYEEQIGKFNQRDR
jgi:type VI secretion system FHA domain protein